jgi:glyoxylase-like metal-dependent hydrolase (beta-lactamase superfamily II)
VLISGDQVLPSISSNISYGFRFGDPNPLLSYLDSLQRLRALPADTLVLPSHGLPFYGLQQRIDDLTTHHEEQLAKVEERCREPQTAVDILPFMFRRELKGMHLFLALGEALAHLEYLAQQRRVERVESAGIIRYQKRFAVGG